LGGLPPLPVRLAHGVRCQVLDDFAPGLKVGQQSGVGPSECLAGAFEDVHPEGSIQAFWGWIRPAEASTAYDETRLLRPPRAVRPEGSRTSVV
jgi:hypothetical protein